MARDPWYVRWGQRLSPPTAPKQLIASAQNIDLDDGAAIQSALNRRQQWQKQAFDAEEVCAPLSYAVTYQAALMSQLVLFGAEQPDNTDAEPIRTENTQVQSVVDRLGNMVARAEIQRLLTRQLCLPGEAYLVCIKPDTSRPPSYRDAETWEIRSIEEASYEGGTLVLRDSNQDEQPLVLSREKGDTWIRIWLRSDRFRGLATSQTRPLLDVVDELMWWDAAARARAKSRLSDAGAWGIPQDIETIAETEEELELSGSDRFVKKFQAAHIASINDPGGSEAAAPILFTYPPNEQRKSGVEPLVLERPQDEMLKERTELCLNRIAQGVNVPNEVVKGIGESGRWSGGEVSESTFRDHGKPTGIVLCNALTIAVMHPILRAMNVPNWQKYMFWFDASNLISHPDIAQGADRGLELLTIGPPAWRRARGFKESDKPTPEEREEMIDVLQKVRGRTPMQQAPVDPSTEDPEKSPRAPDGITEPGQHPSENDRATTNRGKGQPFVSSSNGHDPGYHTQVFILREIAEEHVRRALEKAGNRLRSRANKSPSYKEAIRTTPSSFVAATLGREAVTKLGVDDIFEGCFDDLGSAFTRVLGRHVNTSTLSSELAVVASAALHTGPPDDHLVSLDLIDKSLRTG